MCSGPDGVLVQGGSADRVAGSDGDFRVLLSFQSSGESLSTERWWSKSCAGRSRMLVMGWYLWSCGLRPRSAAPVLGAGPGGIRAAGLGTCGPLPSGVRCARVRVSFRVNVSFCWCLCAAVGYRVFLSLSGIRLPFCGPCLCPLPPWRRPRVAGAAGPVGAGSG